MFSIGPTIGVAGGDLNGIAVDPATDNILAVEANTRRVFLYRSTGLLLDSQVIGGAVLLTDVAVIGNDVFAVDAAGSDVYEMQVFGSNLIGPSGSFASPLGPTSMTPYLGSDLAIGDAASNRVFRINQSGATVSDFSVGGDPLGVATTSAGEYIVAVSPPVGINEVRKYDALGSLVWTNLESNATGITVDQAGTSYAVTSSGAIRVIDSAGVDRSAFSVGGASFEDIEWHDGVVWISDNNAIRRFGTRFNANGTEVIPAGSIVGEITAGAGDVAQVLSGDVVARSVNGIELTSGGSLQIDGGTVTALALNAADGVLDLIDGSLTISNVFDIGTSSLTLDSGSGSETATLRLIQNATANIPSGFGTTVGLNNNAELHIEGGSVFTSGDDTGLGRFAGSDGSAVIDGAGSRWDIGGQLRLGREGAGSITIQNGGAASVTSSTRIGLDPGAGSGELIVDGTGSTFDAFGVIRIGEGTHGSLTALSGGSVNSLTADIARDPNSSGTVIITDPNSLWNVTGDLNVAGNSSAAGGIGSLTVSNAASTTVSGTTRLWNDATLTIDGGASLATTSLIHNSGGTLNHHDGTLTIDAGTFDLGTASYTLDSDNGASTAILELTGGTTANVPSGFGTTVGLNNNAELHIEGGSVFTSGDDTGLGRFAGSDGTAVIDGVFSRWDVGGQLRLGREGAGSITVQNGGTLTSTSTARISQDVGGTGSLTVDGPLSSFEGSSLMRVGENGNGTLNVTGGGTSTSVGVNVAENAGSIGNVSITGLSSELISTDSLNIGGNNSAVGGTGSVSIDNSASASVSGTTRIWGNGSLTIDGVSSLTTGSLIHTSGGTLNLDDGTLTIDGGTFDLGSSSYTLDAATPAGYATLKLINGATANIPSGFGTTIGLNNDAILRIESGSVFTSGDDTGLGRFIGSNSLAVVDGVGSRWDITGGEFRIGRLGSGAVQVTGGGAMSSVGLLRISMDAGGGGGTLSIDGDGSSYTSNNARVGESDEGHLNVTGGATFTENGSMRIGLSVSGDGTVMVDGTGTTVNGTGGWRVGEAGSGTLSVTGAATLSVNNLNVAEDPNSTGDVTFSGAGTTVSSNIDLNIGGSSGGVGGTATVTIDDSADVAITDTTRIWNNGTLTLQGGRLDSQSFVHTAGGTFDFTGGVLSASTFDGSLTNQGGTLAPGDSPGITAVSGNYDQQSAATLQIEIASAAGTAGIDHDQLNVTGTATLGGTLDVDFLSGFFPTPGNTFDIISYSSRTGEFATLDGAGLIDPDTVLVPVYGPTGVTLVTAIAGDVNLDGTVNGLDANVVSANFLSAGAYADGDVNFDGVVNGLDANLISAHFLQSNPASAIPEPRSAVLITVALSVIALQRLRALRR